MHNVRDISRHLGTLGKFEQQRLKRACVQSDQLVIISYESTERLMPNNDISPQLEARLIKDLPHMR